MSDRSDDVMRREQEFFAPDGYPGPLAYKAQADVFYLNRGSWHHLMSRDLVAWQDLGPAITPDENDRTIATGSIVEKDGVPT